MIAEIILALICLVIILLLCFEVRSKNRCPHCRVKLEWQDRGKELSPLGHQAMKQAGYCPKCEKDIKVRYIDDVYY